MKRNSNSSKEKLSREDNRTKNTKSGYGIGMKMSLDLVSSVITGSLIGLGVDIFFSTKPIFFIIFLLLGIITGFYNIFKSMQKLNKK